MSEFDSLQLEQGARIMPLIGQLLDVFDGLSNDQKCSLREDAPDLYAAIKKIESSI